MVYMGVLLVKKAQDVQFRFLPILFKFPAWEPPLFLKKSLAPISSSRVSP